MAASWICFWLEIFFISRFALVTLPDGSITADYNRDLVISGLLFIIIIAVGGLLFFRKMTRRELFCSASVLVALNILFGLISEVQQGMFSFYWFEFSEWSGFVERLLFDANLNQWIGTVILWVLPYLFVLFGKKRLKE